MKIYRDGKEFELTAEELRMAYEEKRMEYFAEDICDIDGEVGDCIMQYATFGEVIYG